MLPQLENYSLYSTFTGIIRVIVYTRLLLIQSDPSDDSTNDRYQKKERKENGDQSAFSTDDRFPLPRKHAEGA